MLQPTWQNLVARRADPKVTDNHPFNLPRNYLRRRRSPGVHHPVHTVQTNNLPSKDLVKVAFNCAFVVNTSYVRILVVEDDEPIAEALTSGLTREGFEVCRVRTGNDALNSLPTDFILLDLGLPDRDGIGLFESLRAVSSAPIIMVTARGAEEDRIAGLNLGADDYVVKPFGVRELVARINAVTRRISRFDSDANSPQILGDMEIDRRLRTITLCGVQVACTPKEFGILEFLARDPGAVITRQELLDGVWGPHWFGPTKMMDVHIASLRHKLGRHDFIETLRGVGFKFTVTEA